MLHHISEDSNYLAITMRAVDFILALIWLYHVHLHLNYFFFFHESSTMLNLMYGHKLASKPLFHIRQNVVQLIFSIHTAVLEFKLLNLIWISQKKYCRCKIINIPSLSVFQQICMLYSCEKHVRTFMHCRISWN
jgi:hypothetical protein